METLFVEPKQVFRRSNGQYATKEMAYADKQAKENQYLKFELEKYKRMYLAVAKDNEKLNRKLNSIKDILNKQ